MIAVPDGQYFQDPRQTLMGRVGAGNAFGSLLDEVCLKFGKPASTVITNLPIAVGVSTVDATGNGLRHGRSQPCMIRTVDHCPQHVSPTFTGITRAG